MKLIKNEGLMDRFFRFLIAEILFITAFFWLNNYLALTAYILAFVFLIIGLTGFCLLYIPFNFNTIKSDIKITRTKYVLGILVIILVGFFGSYYSNFFTKKFFIEDYNKMNNYYKQTLFYTGQNKRQEALDNYNNLNLEYQLFLNKYINYHPPVVRKDKNLNEDLKKIEIIIIGIKEEISVGDLQLVHKKLETVRPIFQDILKRNNFSMLAISLVDFHDAMEKIIIAADNHNPKELIEVYTEVDAKLKTVEEISNDSEIMAIRQKLEEVYGLAKSSNTSDLSAKAAELKSSFVKVYLKRG